MSLLKRTGKIWGRTTGLDEHKRPPWLAPPKLSLTLTGSQASAPRPTPVTSSAMRWTLALPIALLVLAGLSCLWIKGRSPA
jgi:hypothetical protein